MIFHI